MDIKLYLFQQTLNSYLFISLVDLYIYIYIYIPLTQNELILYDRLLLRVTSMSKCALLLELMFQTESDMN